MTATRFYCDFRDSSCGTVAVAGLVSDDRVASITLICSRAPDAEATLGGGTFVIPALAGLSETSSRARLTARDAAGHELERLPYRQDD
jgi:glycerol kinase